MSIPMVWIWIGLFLIFLVIEALTVTLITIWFALASLISMVSVIFGANLLSQIIIFLLSSVVLLIFTKPILKKYVYSDSDKIKTNVNSLLGEVGIVCKDITEHNMGQVKVNGQIWSAVSDGDMLEIKTGENVEISGVSGVKLLVKQIQKNN